MYITEEQPGVFVAVLDMPPTPSEMGQLAGMLPADAFCVDAELDEDTLYMTWEQ